MRVAASLESAPTLLIAFRGTLLTLEASPRYQNEKSPKFGGFM